MSDTELKPRGQEQYFSMLQSLLPRGLAWTRNLGSRLSLLLYANADELSRLDSAIRLLPDEINPLTTINGLEDWERVLGLPDACFPSGNTMQERRYAVLTKLRDEGRQDLDYWYSVADSLGFDVTIEEHWPFICGISECSDISGLSASQLQAYPEVGYTSLPDVRFWWNVIVHGNRVILFRCGESECGDLLMDWTTAETLECVMKRDKQAHTLLTFEYEE